MARLFVGAGKLSRNVQEARAAMKDLDASLGAMDMPEPVFEAMVADAARFVTPHVRGAMMVRYRTSGIGKSDGPHTGWLARAVAGLTVKPGKRSLLIRFPQGLAPVGESDAYKVGASLQYGSVRTGGQHLGAKAKKSFKAAGGVEGLTKRQLTSLTRGVRQVHSGKVITRGAVDISKITVTKPWKFFTLDAGTKASLYQIFVGRLRYLIQRRRQKAA